MVRVPVTGYSYSCQWNSYEWSVYGHSYEQTLVNSDTIKILLKSVKYLEFLVKVYATITSNVYVAVDVKITLYIYYSINK